MSLLGSLREPRSPVVFVHISCVTTLCVKKGSDLSPLIFRFDYLFFSELKESLVNRERYVSLTVNPDSTT